MKLTVRKLSQKVSELEVSRVKKKKEKEKLNWDKKNRHEPSLVFGHVSTTG